jgi:hypothetical protein
MVAGEEIGFRPNFAHKKGEDEPIQKGCRLVGFDRLTLAHFVSARAHLTRVCFSWPWNLLLLCMWALDGIIPAIKIRGLVI